MKQSILAEMGSTRYLLTRQVGAHCCSAIELAGMGI